MTPSYLFISLSRSHCCGHAARESVRRKVASFKPNRGHVLQKDLANNVMDEKRTSGPRHLRVLPCGQIREAFTAFRKRGKE
jgi:hypothetical protein